MHVCVCVCVCVCMYPCTCIQINVCTCACVCVRVHMYTYIYTHICPCTCIQIFMYGYIHICTTGWQRPIGWMPYLIDDLWHIQALIVGLFCGKRRIKIRHPMTLRHPVHAHSCNATETHSFNSGKRDL